MVIVFEGPRNSGKTFLANHFSKMRNLPIFKFEFVDWFNSLGLDDKEETTHLFALGKETMLMQLHRDGLLRDFVLDRGFLTVFTWAIISGRISEAKALEQIEIIIKKNLLKEFKIVRIHGRNPDSQPRNKDNWDFRDHSDEETLTLQKIINHIKTKYPSIDVIELENDFTDLTLEKIKRI